MNLPGTNSITLSYEALTAIVKEHLNRASPGYPVRILRMDDSRYYQRQITFEITTDEPAPAPSSVFAQPQMPEPDPPVLLPASVGGIPL